MMSAPSPEDRPAPETLSSVFHVYEVRERGERLLYFGEPLANQQRIMEAVWPAFREAGYEVHLTRQTGEFVLVAEPRSVGEDAIPWTNVALFVATVLSTLFVGAQWYYVRDPLSTAIVSAIPFTLAVMGVLGTHELGHYVMSRYHDVDASLPYFIPFPTIVGTMGAVIRMRGQIPDREALFDIGVAGPIAGLLATVVVSAVGLMLPPVAVPEWVLAAQSTVEVEFGYPPLLHAIAWQLDAPLVYDDPTKVINPVVIGGWVAMFITFLNLIPVGQLDGGHILRAMVGPAQERIAPLVPTALFALAGYLFFVRDVGQVVGIWVLWGIMAAIVSAFGSARPIDDSPLDGRRVAIGIVTFVIGALCFTPVPIQIVGP
ncbi:membrane associated metalloprotease [Halanaeroarchaeum sulfurireducens]|uniref:Membrane associated metalloprotease n=2 Tax=Halanaeroarchaeum sulfurireducens TaxID=1604004 RepID=A0A0N9MG47_9EURY|nr:site-2 protease family protein [Halanaeroarchaeum sulfurireducens]ALG81105.1 membrane associated metalloprotease [Halanaeroarchaeum sulfurireducens]